MAEAEVIQGLKLGGGRCCEDCGNSWFHYTCGKCKKRHDFVDTEDDDISWDDDFNKLHKCNECGTINKVEDD